MLLSSAAMLKRFRQFTGCSLTGGCCASRRVEHAFAVDPSGVCLGACGRPAGLDGDSFGKAERHLSGSVVVPCSRRQCGTFGGKCVATSFIRGNAVAESSIAAVGGSCD
jgi:hypothetical protein